MSNVSGEVASSREKPGGAATAVFTGPILGLSLTLGFGLGLAGSRL
jgi:hypothetical protein